MLPKIIKMMETAPIAFFTIRLRVEIFDPGKQMYTDSHKSAPTSLTNVLLKVFHLLENMEDYLQTDLLVVPKSAELFMPGDKLGSNYF